ISAPAEVLTPLALVTVNVHPAVCSHGSAPHQFTRSCAEPSAATVVDGLSRPQLETSVCPAHAGSIASETSTCVPFAGSPSASLGTGPSGDVTARSQPSYTTSYGSGSAQVLPA